MYPNSLISNTSENNQWGNRPEYITTPSQDVSVKTRTMKTPTQTRIVYTTSQLRFLEESYSRCKYLDRHLRFQLAQNLQVSERNVKLWFQNRRMKDKKLALESSSNSSLGHVSQDLLENVQSPIIQIIYPNQEKDTFNKITVKPKQKRIGYTTEQLTVLEESYSHQKYLTRKLRKELAEYLHVTERNVKVWFQNRRIKGRKQCHDNSSHWSSKPIMSQDSLRSTQSPIIHILSPNQERPTDSPINALSPNPQNYIKATQSPIINILSPNQESSTDSPIDILYPNPQNYIKATQSPIINILSPNQERPTDSPINALSPNPQNYIKATQSPIINIYSPNQERPTDSPINALSPNQERFTDSPINILYPNPQNHVKETSEQTISELHSYHKQWVDNYSYVTNPIQTKDTSMDTCEFIPQYNSLFNDYDYYPKYSTFNYTQNYQYDNNYSQLNSIEYSTYFM